MSKIKLPSVGEAPRGNNIYLFEQRFQPRFYLGQSGEVLVSETIVMKDFKCQNKINLDISVKIKTGGTIVSFYCCDPKDENFSDRFLQIINTPSTPLFWKDLAQKRKPATLNGRFIDWPKPSADFFFEEVWKKMVEKNGKRKIDHLDVENVLSFFERLDWGENARDFPKRTCSILLNSALSFSSNPYLKYGDDYMFNFLGMKAKDLAYFCLATGKFPNEEERKNLEERTRNKGLIEGRE